MKVCFCVESVVKHIKANSDNLNVNTKQSLVKFKNREKLTLENGIV